MQSLRATSCHTAGRCAWCCPLASRAMLRAVCPTSSSPPWRPCSPCWSWHLGLLHGQIQRYINAEKRQVDLWAKFLLIIFETSHYIAFQRFIHVMSYGLLHARFKAISAHLLSPAVIFHKRLGLTKTCLDVISAFESELMCFFQSKLLESVLFTLPIEMIYCINQH